MEKQKTQKAQKITLSQLAERIPFNTDVHLNMGSVHSSKHKNKRLNIVCETHAYFENSKQTRSDVCFYEDIKFSKTFNTLPELLKANKGIKEKATKLYGKKQQSKKPKHHLVARKGI